MPTLNDIQQRGLKYVTGTGNSSDLTGGKAARIYAFTLTVGAVSPGAQRLHIDPVGSSTITRNMFRVTADFPTVTKTWSPTGLAAPTGFSVTGHGNSPTWTVAYTED